MIVLSPVSMYRAKSARTAGVLLYRSKVASLLSPGLVLLHTRSQYDGLGECKRVCLLELFLPLRFACKPRCEFVNVYRDRQTDSRNASAGFALAPFAMLRELKAGIYGFYDGEIIIAVPPLAVCRGRWQGGSSQSGSIGCRHRVSPFRDALRGGRSTGPTSLPPNLFTSNYSYIALGTG
jgi:hypothetical protein